MPLINTSANEVTTQDAKNDNNQMRKHVLKPLQQFYLDSGILFFYNDM